MQAAASVWLHVHFGPHGIHFKLTFHNSILGPEQGFRGRCRQPDRVKQSSVEVRAEHMCKSDRSERDPQATGHRAGKCFQQQSYTPNSRYNSFNSSFDSPGNLS